MPTYCFRNTETGEEFEVVMSMSELDQFKEDNPDLTQFFDRPPNLSKSGIMGMGRMKNDDGWKDNLNRIANHHPGTKLNDIYGTKSIKEIKTRQVIDKHRKIQQSQKKT